MNVFLILLSTAFWGLSFSLIKPVMQYTSPLAFLCMRFSFAALLLVFVLIRYFKLLHKSSFIRGGVLALILCSYMVLQNKALLYTSASSAAFISSFSVILVPLLSLLLLRQNIPNGAFFAAILSIGGLFLISGANLSSFNYGDFLTLICSILIAVHIIFTSLFVKKENPVVLACCQIIFTAFFSFIAWQLFEPFTFHSIIFTSDLIIAVAVTGIFCTAFAFIAQTIAQYTLSAEKVAILLAFEPLFALLFEILLKTSSLSWQKTLGCSLMFVGSLVASKNE